MEEYYLKQKGSVEKMRELGSQIKFYPKMHQQILMNWLDSIKIDWPISRRRYYGTEFQFGIVKNDQSHTCQSQESIISLGIWNVRQRYVTSEALPRLLAWREPSIPGWTLVVLHYSLHNSKRMRSFSKVLTHPQ